MLFLYIRLPVKKPTPIQRRVVRLRYTYKKKLHIFTNFVTQEKKPSDIRYMIELSLFKIWPLPWVQCLKGSYQWLNNFFFGGGSYDIYVEYVAFCVFPHYVISGMGGILCGKQGKNFFRRKKSEVFFVKITF